MSLHVTLDFPDEALSALRTSPDEFTAELRLAAAAKWYELGRVSQEQAAEIAGLSRRDFLDALARFGVSPFQVTAEELAREVASAKTMGR